MHTTKKDFRALLANSPGEVEWQQKNSRICFWVFLLQKQNTHWKKNEVSRKYFTTKWSFSQRLCSIRLSSTKQHKRCRKYLNDPRIKFNSKRRQNKINVFSIQEENTSGKVEISLLLLWFQWIWWMAFILMLSFAKDPQSYRLSTLIHWFEKLCFAIYRKKIPKIPRVIDYSCVLYLE